MDVGHGKSCVCIGNEMTSFGWLHIHASHEWVKHVYKGPKYTDKFFPKS